MKDRHNLGALSRQQEEAGQIKKDLVWVLVLNGLFFVALFGLFFFNRASGQVDQFFASLLKF